MPITSEQLDHVVERARRHGATRLVLFGSAARMPQEAHDVDLACDGIDGWRLYAFAGELENQLGVMMDVVPLSPPTRFTEHILREGRVLL